MIFMVAAGYFFYKFPELLTHLAGTRHLLPRFK